MIGTPEIITGLLLVISLGSLLFWKSKPVKEEETPQLEIPPRIDPGPADFELRPISEIYLPDRNEHTIIMARTGHGKSWLLKTLIGEDMAAILNGEASAVVLDSKGTLIRELTPDVPERAFELISGE